MARSEIFQLTREIWCIHDTSRRVSSYIVKTSPGAVLVDAGADPTASPLMMGLQQARVGLSSVRALVLTSAHPDAVSGAAALKDRAATRVLASEDVSVELGEASSRSQWRRRKAMPSIAVDGVLREGDALEDRLRVIRLHGGLVLYASAENALFSSDILDALDEAPEVDWLLPLRGRPGRHVKEAR